MNLINKTEATLCKKHTSISLNQKDTQFSYMYNVTQWRVRVTTVAMET